jgi:hypothetical protein
LLILRERLCTFFEPYRGILASCRASLPSSINQDIVTSQQSSVTESMPTQEDPSELDVERPAKISKIEHTPTNSLLFVSVRRAVELWEDSRVEVVSLDDIRSSKRDDNEMQGEDLGRTSRFQSNVGDDAGDVEREFNAILTKQDFASFKIQYVRFTYF